MWICVFFIATKTLSVVQSNRPYNLSSHSLTSLAISAVERLAPLTVWVAGRPATVTSRSQQALAEFEGLELQKCVFRRPSPSVSTPISLTHFQ
jgi:hypothetical protein